MENEAEIIRKARDGDRRAQEKIFRKYVDAGVSIAFLITRDWGMAEDAVQESFIRAFKYLNKFDFSKPFKPWFTKIVVNQSKKVIKRRFIWTEIDDYRNFENECSLTEDKASQKEEIDSLIEEMARLPEKYRITIILKYFGGFSESEIGLILGLPVSTVKSRLYTGRVYLKKGLTIGQEV